MGPIHLFRYVLLSCFVSIFVYCDTLVTKNDTTISSLFKNEPFMTLNITTEQEDLLNSNGYTNIAILGLEDVDKPDSEFISLNSTGEEVTTNSSGEETSTGSKEEDGVTTLRVQNSTEAITNVSTLPEALEQTGDGAHAHAIGDLWSEVIGRYSWKRVLDDVPPEISPTENDYNKDVSALPEALEQTGDGAHAHTIGVGESAMILAGTFVVLAAASYGGMVFYRRVLQVRYGNSEMLITEDAYDISDLRNFEI